MFKKLFVFIASFVAFTNAAAPIIHNSTAAFVTFWEKAKDLPLEQQVEEFERTVVPAFPEFCAFKFKDWEESGASKAEALKKVFDAYRPIHEKFAEKSATLEKDFEAHLKTFMQAFPDCSADFEIYITHSLSSMAGGTRTIDGKHYNIFGLDVILTHLSENSTTPFFHHELVHFHQHNIGFEETDDFWVNLWSEGLATYVSEALNPGCSAGDVLLCVHVEECKANLPFLWSDLQKNLETKDKETYNKYFMLPASSDKRIPACTGYYLGYLIAKELGKTYSVQQLVVMKPSEFLPHIKRIIAEQIAAQPAA